jgi:hypothetical protein
MVWGSRSSAAINRQGMRSLFSKVVTREKRVRPARVDSAPRELSHLTFHSGICQGLSRFAPRAFVARPASGPVNATLRIAPCCVRPPESRISQCIELDYLTFRQETCNCKCLGRLRAKVQFLGSRNWFSYSRDALRLETRIRFSTEPWSEWGDAERIEEKRPRHRHLVGCEEFGKDRSGCSPDREDSVQRH